MKRLAFIMMALLLALMPAAAQNYRDSRYYNKQTGHLDYRYNHNYGSPYYGFRIGPAFTFVNSDDSRLDGGDWQTGLNVGVVTGIPLTDSAPLYLETGLSYIEKGGKKDLPEGKKMTYDLNYLEIPAVLKYKYEVDDHFSIQPQVGGYFAVGVGGKIKNFAEREAESSFKDANFRRLDGGIRIGCGIGYDMFYADLTKAGMTDDQLGMLPIYIGVDGEENQGLCSGGENYWCVSSQASEDAQKATEDFMYWCVTSDTATSIIADKMGLTAPFKSAKETTNVFSQQAVAMAKDGKKTVAWDFVYIPSEEWKKNLKQALIAYAADNTKWDGVKNAFVDGWKTEKAASE